ncbi:hypothetical protein [Methanomethylovorans sp.]
MIRTVHIQLDLQLLDQVTTVLPPGYELVLEDPVKFICGYTLIYLV